MMVLVDFLICDFSLLAPYKGSHWGQSQISYTVCKESLDAVLMKYNGIFSLLGGKRVFHQIKVKRPLFLSMNIVTFSILLFYTDNKHT